MILIIDTGDETPWRYVKFSPTAKHVVLDGTFDLVARFEVLDRDEDGDVSVIRDLKDPTK